MTATVIPLWSGEHEKRIRIPGPGEEFAEPATVTILPVIRAELRRPKPGAAPRRRTRHFEDDERHAEPIGPGDDRDGQKRR